jgi:uncharacterized protein (DUF433 family)
MSLIKGPAFKNIDPRELPIYTPTEAAHYLRVNLSTLRTWIYGYIPRPRQSGKKIPAVIHLPSPHSKLMSFYNLVEAHILSSIRHDHDVPLPKIRSAVNYLEKEFSSRHPLVDKRLEAGGRSMFVRHLGKLIDAGNDGQLAMEQVLDNYLKRITWDAAGLAQRLFPYVRTGAPGINQPRSIMMDPSISGGRPVLVGTGVPSQVVQERFLAGESPDELAADYNRKREEIDEILRFEAKLAA